MARGVQTLACSQTPDAIEATCAIGEGIAGTRSFIDGNRRTAFGTLNVALTANGLKLETRPCDAACFVVNLASRRVHVEEFRDTVRKRIVPDTPIHPRIRDESIVPRPSFIP